MIQKGVAFKKLDLVILDEQHRFGIDQRAALAKRKNHTVPHLLLDDRHADPPHTGAATVYGDLDLALIDQMPAGRKRIETRLFCPMSGMRLTN